MKMSKYKVSEPSALKFLKANGAVIDENGNVVSDASDYWKKVYDQAEPKVAKYLHADGTIDENPGSGGEANLEDNKEIEITENGEVEITPSSGYDGMKKVTANINVSGGGVSTLYAFVHDEYVYYSPTLDLNAGDKLLAIVITGHDPDNDITIASYDSSTNTATDENDTTYQYDSTKNISLV
jgi:hypothetical protein